MPDFDLRALARLSGVAPSYRDVDGDVVSASPDVLRKILRAVGTLGDTSVSEALDERRSFLRRRLLEPCAASWTDGPATLRLRRPLAAALLVQVFDESQTMTVEKALDAGETCAQLGDLGIGYYELRLSSADVEERQHLLRAPRACFEIEGGRRWGIFAPLYAMKPDLARQGGASFTELQALYEAVAERGGEVVGTLPLLAGFHGPVDLQAGRFEQSPYRPVSRRHWNELFLDLGKLSKLDACPPARERFESEEFVRKGRALAEADEVDLSAIAAHKHELLRLLAEWVWTTPEPRAELDAFLAAEPDVAAYAAFRAELVAEPEREAEHALHAYAQWQCHQQLAELRASTGGPYLDLAVGVHPDGYDARADAEDFVGGVNVGAPPDGYFRSGQNWGLPALHPERGRLSGHRSFREAVAAHMRYASMLRLDHVMGLHRIYWIPQGASAKDGTYVHYPAEELYAIVAIESQRKRCAVIGEDLGLVASNVRRALEEHRMGGMFVGQFDLGGTQTASPRAVASFGTHDTASFAGFRQALDLKEQHDAGLLDDALFAELLAEREKAVAFLAEVTGTHEAPQQLEIFMGLLAAGPAETLLISLEDLWLEARQQNLPGSSGERGNWRQRFARDWRQALEEAAPLLAQIDAARRDR